MQGKLHYSKEEIFRYLVTQCLPPVYEEAILHLVKVDEFLRTTTMDQKYFFDEYQFYYENGRVRTKEERQAMNYWNLPTWGKEESLLHECDTITASSNTVYITGGASTSDYGWKDIDLFVNPPLYYQPIITYYNKLPTKEEGETTMTYRYEGGRDLPTNQMEFLFAQLRDLRVKAPQALEKKYFINDDQYPQTAEDLIDRIKNDKFKLLDKAERDRRYDAFGDGPFDGLIWRTHDADRDGYDAAVKEFYNKADDLNFTIMTGDYDVSVSALKDLKAQYVN